LLLSGTLAQLVEQRTFNPLVVGSNPSRPTNKRSLGRVTKAFLFSAWLAAVQASSLQDSVASGFVTSS